MTNEHTSLEKYTSHTLFSKWLRKGYVWEVSWRLNKLQHIDPQNSSVFSSTSFSFCWAAQSEVLRAHSPLLGAGSLYSILSPTNWLQTSTNRTCLWPRVISLFDIHLLPVSLTFAPNSTRPRSRLYPDIFDRMHLFLDWRLGRRSICYQKNKKTYIEKRQKHDIATRKKFSQ